jgi:RNA polymerase sigma factor (sigma-70 family)
MHQVNNSHAQAPPDCAAVPTVVSQEEYGCAYQQCFPLTVRFLGSKGLSSDIATEIAQSAWTKGWECRSQLRDSAYLLTWVNSIALNAYRGLLRREQKFEALPEISIAPRLDLAAIDVTRILDGCRPRDRIILQQHHLEERPIQEIAHEYACSETAMRIRLLRARRSATSRLRLVSVPDACREDRSVHHKCDAA